MINIYDFIANNNNLFKKFEVDNLSFVEYKCLFPEDSVCYYTTNNYFVYVLGGHKKWITGNHEYIVHDGQAIFIRKGAYIAQKYLDEDFCALLIFVPDDFIRSVVNKYSSNYPPGRKLPADDDSDSIIRLTIDQSFSAYFHSVLSYFPKSVSPPRELLTIKFEELILTILACPKNTNLAACLYAIRENGKLSVREVMESYFMHNMSLEEYARLCARSLSSFKSDFYDIYKMSPGKWLTARRLEYAKLLIKTTDESINEVSFKSGFKNTSHFVRVFKDMYGKSPLQHRFA